MRSGELIDSGSVGEWRIPEFTEELDGKCKNVVLLSVLSEEELIRTQFWRSCRRGKKKKIRYSDSARCEESPMSVRKFFRKYYANGKLNAKLPVVKSDWDSPELMQTMLEQFGFFVLSFPLIRKKVFFMGSFLYWRSKTEL